jgi:hypothetical protein
MLMRLYHGRYTEQIEIADAATILMVGLIFDRSSVLDFARYLRVLAVGRMADPGHQRRSRVRLSILVWPHKPTICCGTISVAMGHEVTLANTGS